MDFNLTKEQEAFRQRVNEVAKALAPLVLQERDDINPEIRQALVDSGVLGACFPRRYGGADEPGYRAMNLCLAREGLSRANPDADLYIAMAGLGSYPIFLAGTEEQKQKYLTPVSRGEKMAAFCLTEADAGSDVAHLKTMAERKGDKYILNGRKCFISMATAAGVFSTFARTGPDEGAKGVSAFIVTPDMPGMRIRHLPMTAPDPIGEVFFEDCEVPAENLLGQEGQGIKIALSTLDVFRGSVGAHALGLAEGALDMAVAWARRRRVFGQAVADFQMIQAKLAEMATEIEAARWLVYNAAWRKDNGMNITKESAMAKMYATEMSLRVINHAVQIHGGYGVCKEFPIERYYRQVRAPIIYEGTSEIQRIVIARQVLKAAAAAEAEV